MATVLKPSDSFILPKGSVHHTWTEVEETIVQVTFIGPTGATFVNPADDPRNTEKEQASKQKGKLSGATKEGCTLKKRSKPALLSPEGIILFELAKHSLGSRAEMPNFSRNLRLPSGSSPMTSRRLKVRRQVPQTLSLVALSPIVPPA
jgi:hypothetical protein